MFEVPVPSLSRRGARKALGLALMLSAAWGSMTAGCSSSVASKPGEAKGCTLNSDCATPLVCSFGLCHVACNTSADCGRSESCVSDQGMGVCQLAQEATCTRNSDCPGTLTCAVDGQCRAQCSAPKDCLKGQLCAEGGVCADTSDVGAGNMLKGGQTDGGVMHGGSGGTTGAGGTSGNTFGGTTGTGVGGKMHREPAAPPRRAPTQVRRRGTAASVGPTVGWAEARAASGAASLEAPAASAAPPPGAAQGFTPARRRAATPRIARRTPASRNAARAARRARRRQTRRPLATSSAARSSATLRT